MYGLEDLHGLQCSISERLAKRPEGRESLEVAGAAGD